MGLLTWAGCPCKLVLSGLLGTQGSMFTVLWHFQDTGVSIALGLPRCLLRFGRQGHQPSPRGLSHYWNLSKLTGSPLSPRPVCCCCSYSRCGFTQPKTILKEESRVPLSHCISVLGPLSPWLLPIPTLGQEMFSEGLTETSNHFDFLF